MEQMDAQLDAHQQKGAPAATGEFIQSAALRAPGERAAPAKVARLQAALIRRRGTLDKGKH